MNLKRVGLVMIFAIWWIGCVTVRAEHGQKDPKWINDITDAVGSKCCGISDCFVVENSRVIECGLMPGLCTIEIGGEQGKILSVRVVGHSHDGHNYVCPVSEIGCVYQGHDGKEYVRPLSKCVRCFLPAFQS